jgi:hypothetical protein
MSEEKECPILVLATCVLVANNKIESRSKLELLECKRERCAWWVGSCSCCALPAIVNYLPDKD